MNVYIWTDSPLPYEYSYDFRNKTLAGVQADGWSFPEGTDGVSFNSNGMYKSAQGYKVACYPIDLSSASKATLVGHLTKGASDIDAGFMFKNTSYSYWLSCAITTGYSDTSFRISNGSSNTNVQSYGAMSQGSYTITIIMDFVNKTIYYSYGTNSYTYNLSDSQISYLKGSDFIACGVCKSSSNYIPDISISVE